jgi:hypothetical protein
MLDFMRRHSEGWLIKILLGLIAISFIVFFGYNAVSDRQLGAQTAALVGEEIIPLQQYEESYDEAIKRMQGQFEEGIPENFSKFLRSNVLQQLIHRKVNSEFARSLGFHIADSEVARMIRKQDQFYRDGVFDITYYKRRFRPFYRSRYGIDFEKALREDLLIDLYDTFRLNSVINASNELNWEKAVMKEKWEFQIVTIQHTEAQKHFKDDPNAEDRIKTTLSGWIDLWKKGPLPQEELKTLSARLGDKIKISMLELDQLLGRPLPEEYVKPILQMTQTGSVYPSPIRLGDQWYLVKLHDKTEIEIPTDQPKREENIAVINNEFFTLWLNDFRKQLKIKSNISF